MSYSALLNYYTHIFRLCRLCTGKK